MTEMLRGRPRRRRNLRSVLGVAFAFVATFAVAEEVELAVAGPMVGTSANVGVQYQIGVTAALQTLPNGELLGRRVRVTLHDDNCVSEIARSVALELVEQPPAVVIGHSCSGATIAAAPIYAEHGVLQITPASSNPRVTEMGIGTIFRMIGRDDVQGEVAAARLAERYGDRRIGVLSFPGEYSSGLAEVCIAALARRGIVPVVHVVGEADAGSYVGVIGSLIASDVDVVYLVGGGLDGGVFMRQKRQLDAPFAVIGSDTLVSGVFRQAAEEAAEGVPFTFPPEAATLSSAAQAVDAIRELGHDAAGYTLLAYAATEVWIVGVTRAQSFDAEEVAAAIRSAPVPTILGDVSFDSRGDITTPYEPFAWYVWRNGIRVPAD